MGISQKVVGSIMMILSNKQIIPTKVSICITTLSESLTSVTNDTGTGMRIPPYVASSLRR